MKLSYDPSKSYTAGKYLLHLKLHVSYFISSLSDLSSIQLRSKYGFIAMLCDKSFAVVTTRSDTTDNKSASSIFLPQTSGTEKTAHRTTKLLLAKFAQQVL